MKRKCDRCDNEATVHEVVIRNGEKIERHVCESCAREQGVAIQSSPPISDLITKFVLSQVTPEKVAARAGVCPGCGLTFAEFRQQGLLGCPDCYKVFEPQLGTMIERAHEGAATHVGKRPRRAGGDSDQGERVSHIRRQLQEAIDAEQYERAADLRDQLLRASENTPGATPSGKQPSAKRKRST